MLGRLSTAAPVFLDLLNRVSSVSDSAVSLPVKQNVATRLEPTLLTVVEVAARLRVSTKTVRRRIKDGTIRTVPLGGRLVRVSSDELRRLIPELAPEP